MTEAATQRIDGLVKALVTGPAPKRSYADAAYMRRRREAKGAEWRRQESRRTQAKRRAYRRVAVDHPEELARVLKQELRKEGLA